MDEIGLLQHLNKLPQYYEWLLNESKALNIPPDAIKGFAPFLIPAASNAVSKDLSDPNLFSQGLGKILDGLADIIAAGKSK